MIAAPTTLALIMPKAEARVSVDRDTLERFLAEGLSLEWTFHPLGPIYLAPSGEWKRVADTIIGCPAEFLNGDTLNLTKQNLWPAPQATTERKTT